MRDAVLALLMGVTFGAAAAALRLPAPAPNALAGVIAIAGVYIGFRLTGHFL